MCAFQKIQTDEKERFEPCQFQQSIIQGLNQTGTDLEAVAFLMRLVPNLTTTAMLKPFLTSWWLEECWVGGRNLKINWLFHNAHRSENIHFLHLKYSINQCIELNSREIEMRT